MGFWVFPIWLSPLMLVVGILCLSGYVILSLKAKTENCVHCGAQNPIDALRCANCGENTVLARDQGWGAVLGSLGMVLGMGPLVLLVLSAQNYPEPPVQQLILSGIGIVVFIVGFAALLRTPARRTALKQKAAILRTTFYGGYCANCGTEILGGADKCPKCGWIVDGENPNWAIAAENGKAGLPLVDLKVTCYKCKSENSPNAQKCTECGADLLAYKPVWLRVAYFVVSILFSLGTGWLFFRAIEDPYVYQGLSAIGFGLIALAFVTIALPVYGLYLAFSRGKLAELLAERAGRHVTKNPWRALEDYSYALEFAPVQEHAEIMANRMKLYQTLGLVQNATREELAISYAQEKNPRSGMGLFIAGNVLGDSFSQGYLSGRSKQANKKREKMYTEGRVIMLGYCPVCKEAIELTTDFRCPNADMEGMPKHLSKPKKLQYVIPADIEAGKLALLRALEASRRQTRIRVTIFIIAIIVIVALCNLVDYL